MTEKPETPYIGYIGYSRPQLNARPTLKTGETITCPRCGQEHIVHGGKDEAGSDVDFLLFYECGGETYLAGVQGRNIIGAKPTVSGR